MSLELWSTIASVGTFLVIAATTVAAMIQLRHLRMTNQIAILNDFRTATEDLEFRTAMEFIRGLPEKLKHKGFRGELVADRLPPSLYPINRVGRLYETLGAYVKRGALDQDAVCDLWAPVVSGAWDDMADAIVVMRRSRGPELFENFEYLAYLSQQWLARNPTCYPAQAPRIAPPDQWAAQDGDLT